MVCTSSSLRPACAYTQSDQSLCLSLVYSLTVKLLTEHHLESLVLKGGCAGSSESTLVKLPLCWKSHVTAQLLFKKELSGRPHHPEAVFGSTHDVSGETSPERVLHCNFIS